MSDGMWAGRRVLVTGAGGFIGSHLTEALVAAGANVRALVRYASHGRWGLLDDSSVVTEIEVVAGDVRDPETLKPPMRDVEVVFHLAALIAIPYSYLTPLAYVRTNIEGTVNVLQAATAAGVATVVHTSTSEVYGTALRVPIDEDHPLQGQSPYSATKIGADKLAESFHRAFGLPVVTVRPFNTYGPRQSARAVIPAMITQALNGGPVRLGSLWPTRDLTYVTDTASGMMAAAAASNRAAGRVLNLGVGAEISIRDLAERIGHALGTDLTIEHDAERDRPPDSEVDRLLSDNRRIRDLTGWEPHVSLDEGLRSTIAWITENRDRYRPGRYQL